MSMKRKEKVEGEEGDINEKSESVRNCSPTH